MLEKMKYYLILNYQILQKKQKSF